MDFKKYSYKVKDKKKDWKDTVITKGNIDVDFTLGSHERAIADTEKTLKELNAKYNHEKLIKKNIEQHHPFVLKFSKLEMHTFLMYIEACEVVRQYKPKIKEFQDAIDIDKVELEYVKKMVIKDENTK